MDRKRVRGKHMVASALLMVAAASLASRARSQSLDVTLVDPSITVTQGTTVVDFYATISNPGPSNADPIYLNGDSATTSSLFLTVDDSSFFNNAPISLAPGQNSGPTAFELFAVDLFPTTGVGTYSGNVFSILGGADGGAGTAFGDLADVKFSVSVVSATPTAAPEVDPASSVSALTLLAGCLAVLLSRPSRNGDSRKQRQSIL